jgi:hypothetical protein
VARLFHECVTLDFTEIISLASAILLGWGAVLIGIFVQEVFRNRRERRKVRGLVIAYLDTVNERLTTPLTVFKQIADGVNDAMLPTLIQFINGIRPVETGMEEEIRRNALLLGPELGLEVLLFPAHVDSINVGIREVKGMLETFPPVIKNQTLIDWFTKRSEHFKAVSDYTGLVKNEALRVSGALLRDEKIKVGIETLQQKLREIAETPITNG